MFLLMEPVVKQKSGIMGIRECCLKAHTNHLLKAWTPGGELIY